MAASGDRGHSLPAVHFLGPVAFALCLFLVLPSAQMRPVAMGMRSGVVMNSIVVPHGMRQ